MENQFTLPKKKAVIFWPVATGDSTTLVLKPGEIVMQIDLHHCEKADAPAWPIIDHLVIRSVLLGTATVDELGWDTERLGFGSGAVHTNRQFPDDLESQAEEAIRPWIASLKTEMPPGIIPRSELLGVSLAL